MFKFQLSTRLFGLCLNLGPAYILIFVQFDPVVHKGVRTIPDECNDKSWSFQAVVDERKVRWRQYCQQVYGQQCHEYI